MKKIASLAGLGISLLCLTIVAVAQQPPAVNGDTSLQDTNIKMRSVELERIKREEARGVAAKFAPINRSATAKFPQIKEDFEGIQLAQAAIITAYTSGKGIDYALIEASANKITAQAKRLDANLFAALETATAPATNKKNVKPAQPTGVKELIIELDTVIGSFVASPIFKNLKVVEPEVAIQTRSDLLKIQALSVALAAETAKLK